MTENDVRDPIGTAPLPRPRTAGDDTLAPVEAEPRDGGPGSPWPEQWHVSRAARPRTEYWDVATAGWRSTAR
jgi:hypothetical protein